MAMQTTVDAVIKIRRLLGDDIPATKRLSDIDNAIWSLELMFGEKPKLNIEVIKKKRILCFCNVVSREVSIELDRDILKRIIGIYKEEYNKQLDVCNDIVSKLESTDKDI